MEIYVLFLCDNPNRNKLWDLDMHLFRKMTVTMNLSCFLTFNFSFGFNVVSRLNIQLAGLWKIKYVMQKIEKKTCRGNSNELKKTMLKLCHDWLHSFTHRRGKFERKLYSFFGPPLKIDAHTNCYSFDYEQISPEYMKIVLIDTIAYVWFLFDFTFYSSAWTITLKTEATVIDMHK